MSQACIAPSPTAIPALAGVVPAPPSAPPNLYVISQVRHLMGMPVSLQVRGPEARSPRTAAAMEAAFADLAWVDATFSRWRPESELSRLRRGELTLDECCPQLREVVDRCERAGRDTDGAFAWVLPDADTGAWLLEPTGLVKGWAIARAATILADALAASGHAYCVNAGGDIAVGGADAAPGGDRPWRIGLENPGSPGQIARMVDLRQGGLATSGRAARGAHLIDPATGQPVLRPGSVTVVAPDIVSADVWATALFVGPPQLQARVADRPGWQVIRLGC